MISGDEYDRAEQCVRWKLSELDIREQRALGHGLVDGELSWTVRTDQLVRRATAADLQAASEGSPSADLLAAVAADALACLVALERSEALDISAGSEAA